MYNSDIKNRYLKELSEVSVPTTVKARTVIFNAMCSAEEKYKKDLYNFTIDEIINSYKALISRSSNTLSMMNSCLSAYTNWAINNNLVDDSQNHYSEVSTQLILSCVNSGAVNSMIVTRQDILKDISLLDNPSDQFILLAIFEGICGTGYGDLSDLYFDDFKDGKVYLASGKILEVSDKLVELAEESANQYSYYAMDSKSVRTYEYDQNDTRVIKRLYNASDNESIDNKRRRIINKLIRIEKIVGSYACRTGLMNSGCIDYIKKIAKEENLDYASVINKYRLTKIKERYMTIPTTWVYIDTYKEYFKEA